MMNFRYAISGFAIAIGQTAFAVPPNDECWNPISISGEGTFAFDTTEATTGSAGQIFPCDPSGLNGVDRDIWYCWTPETDGPVTISTCGFTKVDTRISFYLGCDCPEQVEPLCCADDECDAQSQLICDVVCGETYLIQIGSKPGKPGGTGGFRIISQGDPCPDDPTGEPDPAGPCELIAGQCCFGRPAYTADEYTAFGGGPVGAVTASPSILGGQVLTVYDYTDFSSAIPGSNYPATRYSDATWNSTNLGSIFGVTMDGDGNIYVTPSTAYGFDLTGIGGWGDIYRIDAVTSAISVFTTSPLPNSGQGLGNIVYDCENDQFFVTNHEDGKIYRLDSGGNVLSTFDHGTPDDGTSGYAPLGERLWGVTVHGGRVYYSVWREDFGRPSATEVNEVWSIALAGGDFSGSAGIEIGLPPIQTNFSNPVADIRFTDDGRMFVAERGMSSDTATTPHRARLLEFVCVQGVWSIGADYDIGVIAGGTNSAGGVGIDYRPGERIWSTADAIQFTPDTIYGIQGVPDGGGDTTTSVLIDYQGNLDDQDKSQIGDIAISCPTPCGEITLDDIECVIGKDGFSSTYDAVITVTNTSGVDVKYVLFPGGEVDPNIITFDPPLANNSSQVVNVQFTGLAPGEEHCVDFILADNEVNECCTGEICFETPECDCLLFNSVETGCDQATNEPTVTITMTHLAPYVAEHLFVIVESPAGVTVSPDYIDLASIPQFGSFVAGPITISGATAGQEVCLRITTHAESLEECCSEVVCFEVPDCGPGFVLGDINMDGVIDFSDLLQLLAAWGTCANCPEDLNGDGVVDFNDLLLLLANWT